MKTSTRLIITTIAACGTYTATSWWLGGRIETQYTAQLERAREALAGKLTWQRTYRRGLFSSSQDWIVEIPARAGGTPTQAPVRIRLHSDIRHGPVAGGKLVAAVDHTQVQSVEGLPPKLADNVQMDGVLTVTTVHDLRGRWRSNVDVPGGTTMLPLDGQDGTVTAIWQPLHADVRGDSSYREIDGTTQWSGLQAELVRAGRQAALTLTDWSSRHHLEPDPDAWLLTPARFSASVASIQWTETTTGPADTATPMLNLSNVDYDLDRRASGSFIELQQNLSGEGRFGAIRLDRFDAEQLWQQLDRQALQDLQPLLMAALFSGDPEQGLNARALEPILRRLADAGPRYAERINATLDGASGHVQWRLALAPRPDAGTGPRMALPMRLEWLSRLDGEAELQLPSSWLPAIARQVQDAGGPSAETLRAQLDVLVAQGLLREEDDAYILLGEYRDGRLRINGQTVFGLN